MVISEIIEFFEDIPATFWGVVFGSFFSILGVWLTNRASSERLKHQFDHERLLKTKERELALKKDIYLDAAEAISVAIQTLGNLGNLDIANDKVMERYGQKSPALAKVQVVGSMELLDAMMEFSGEHASLILKLFQTRHQLIAQKAQISNLDLQVAGFNKEADRFLEMMKQYNIAGIADPKKWEVLQGNFDFEHKRSIDTQKQRQDIAYQLALKHIEFIRECTSAAISVSPLVIPILAAARKELEIPLEMDTYKKSMQQSHDRQRRVMEEYLGNISAAIAPSQRPN